MDSFIELGLIGLFISALLSATILPLSSEVVLSALLINHFEPLALIVIATTGNVLGSIINYGLGMLIHKGVAIKSDSFRDKQLENAEIRFQKYGLFSLCFAWVPVLGDPLTIVAGLLRVNFIWFLILVTIGKLARYVVISYFILKTVSS